MWREIDILRRALDKDCALVDKSSNILWSEQDIERASALHQFEEEDALLPPDNDCAVTGLFPSCPHQHGAVPTIFRHFSVGQTKHFVIFRCE